MACFTAALHMVGAHLVPQPPPPDDAGRQITYFFIIPTLCTAACALCFVVASVSRHPS